MVEFANWLLSVYHTVGLALFLLFILIYLNLRESSSHHAWGQKDYIREKTLKLKFILRKVFEKLCLNMWSANLNFIFIIVYIDFKSKFVHLN